MKKRIITLKEIKKSTQKEIASLGSLLFDLYATIFAGGFAYGLLVLDSEHSIVSVLFGIVSALIALLFLWLLLTIIRKKITLAKNGISQLQIYEASVIGKYKYLMDDSENPYLENRIIIKWKNKDGEYIYRSKNKEFDNVYAGDKAYVVLANGYQMVLLSSDVELSPEVQQYVTPALEENTMDAEEILRHEAEKYLSGVTKDNLYLKCMHCDHFVKFKKYQNCCKYCKMPMGYNTEVVMQQMRKGTCKAEGYTGMFGNK